MGSIQGFLDFKRKDFEYKSIEERVRNYDEFLILQNDREIKKQAGRCMECDVPFCHALGCPSLSYIPHWNDLIYRGDIKRAYEKLISTNFFPEFTGRVCPALCESACTLSINLSPVTIKQIELYIIEKAFSEDIVKANLPKIERSKRVAVIGSGPSGLAAAQQLRNMGYGVTVYEKADLPGGLLRYGIPDFKLPKRVIDRRIDLMQQEGIDFKTNVNVGSDISTEYLKSKFDAVILCMGAGTPRDLSIDGRNVKGIHFAMEYLAQANRFVSGNLFDTQIIDAKNKNVLVIGGGDTGSDCIGTANRQGAKLVTQIEILPKPMEWNKSYNPNWPDYPNILRTSSSHKEGCIRDFGVSTKAFLSENGHVTGVRCVRVEWVKDENDRYVMKEIEGSDFIIEADLVFLSMGFLHVEHSPLLDRFGIDYDARGNIRTNHDYSTNIRGVFAAGDAATGASLVVKAMNHGIQAAKQVDEYLS